MSTENVKAPANPKYLRCVEWLVNQNQSNASLAINEPKSATVSPPAVTVEIDIVKHDPEELETATSVNTDKVSLPLAVDDLDEPVAVMFSRNRVVNMKQIQILVEFLEKHKGLASRRQGISRESRTIHNKLWDQLAIRLNSVSTGVSKNGAEWRKWFTDYKSKLTLKKRNLLPTGQTIAQLGPLEERLCALFVPGAVGPPVVGRSGTSVEEVQIDPLPDVENSSVSEEFSGFMDQAFGEEMVIPFKQEVVATNNLDLNQTRAEETDNLELKQTRIDSPDPQPSTSSGHPYRPPQRQKRARQTSNRRKDIKLGESADENKSALEESRQMLIRLEAKRCKTNRYLADSIKQMAESFSTVAQSIRHLTTEVRNSYRPLHRLRLDNLYLECEWKSCYWNSYSYIEFQKHVSGHIYDLVAVTDTDGIVKYECQWDICYHKTEDQHEILRHINYHSYHTKLLAIGYNARATLNLVKCEKDSTKRNQLPNFIGEHCCMWVGCVEKFKSIQVFLDHVRMHTTYADRLVCSWAGCGLKFTRRSFLNSHLRAHTGEKQIACYHCGKHFSCNKKLSDHLVRQNVTLAAAHECTLCGTHCGSAYLCREHSRQHVSVYACSLCDMSAPSRAALSMHVRYRHLSDEAARAHQCNECSYKAVTIWDLKKHISIHERKKEKTKHKLHDRDDNPSDSDKSDNSTSDNNKRAKKKRKYACHMCPKENVKVFSRGSILTKHLVSIHGAQWPCGHSRFRYQISDDGMYRLTTTRYESLEVFNEIIDGNSKDQELLNNDLEFVIEQTAEATDKTPKQFNIRVKEDNPESEIKEKVNNPSAIEITMCDVDDEGNVIRSKVVNSDLVYES